MSLLCLVVQDGEPPAIEPLTSALRDVGVKTFVAVNYTVARDIISQLTFDLVFLVGTSSPMHRLQAMVRELSDLALPTLVLKAAAPEEDNFPIFEAGAVDVLPIGSSMSIAALKGVRAASNAGKLERRLEPRLSVGALSLDPSAMIARVDGVALALTPKQFDLLFLLASRAGKIVQRRLLERVFGYPPGKQSRSLDMQILRVRRSLRAAGDPAVEITSVYGYGYCLRLPEEAQTTGPDAEAALSTALV